MEENPYKPGSATLATEPPKKSLFFSILKKFFMVVGILFILLVGLLIWVGLTTSTDFEEFEKNVDPFIAELLKEQNPWNYSLIEPHLSRAWPEKSDKAQGDKLFNQFNKLGPFKSIENIEMLKCSTTKHISAGHIKRCNYLVNANYENDKAEILMGLTFEEEQLKIIQIKVSSLVFNDQNTD